MEIIYTTGAASRFASSGKPHIRKCIDGTITGCGKCVGYCRFRDHPGYLTKELRKDHDCIKKGCRYSEPKQKPSAPISPFAVLAAII